MLRRPFPYTAVLAAVLVLTGCASAAPRGAAAPVTPPPVLQATIEDPCGQRPEPAQPRVVENKSRNKKKTPELAARKDDDEIDQTKRYIQETVCSAALWLDGLFGEQTVREVDAARRTSGRAELSASRSQFYGSSVSLHFNARVELTNIKERLSAFVGRDREDVAVRDRTEGFALRTNFPQFDDRDETIAGLGYAFPDNYFVKTEFRTGVRFSGLHVPKLFAHARFAMNAYADDRNLIDLRFSPFVNTADHFGLTASVDYSHVLAPSRLFRWNTVSTVTQKAPGLDWRSAFILYQGLAKKRAIALETFIRGYTVAPVPLVEYGVQTIFRQPLFEERLIGEIVLGYSWPNENPALPREGSYNVAAILDLPF